MKLTHLRLLAPVALLAAALAFTFTKPVPKIKRRPAPERRTLKRRRSTRASRSRRCSSPAAAATITNSKRPR
ncbi:MAG: hypothetical protein R3F11_30350 [Verrucomicrobiales bacterium]